MDKYDSFKQSIKEAVEKFKKWDNDTLRLVSHLDADGISAASILIKAISNENRRYAVSIVQQLDNKILNELRRENYKYYIFTDLGSGTISKIKQILNDKEILILDHHELEDVKTNNSIIHINPHIFNIDGSREISGSGVAYLFSKFLNQKNNMAHIAIIGAIGDMQENNGFMKLNNEILQDAIREKKMSVKKTIRFFGSQTRPIHKLLEYSTDPIIPGVSGSESSAIEFLQNLGIRLKKGIKWRTLNDLTEEEKKKLAAAIIIQRHEEEKPEDIFGNTYTLLEEQEATPFRDAKEFSTLLNACGRMKKASLGIGACLGNQKSKKKAMRLLLDYRREIVNAIEWYEKNIQNKLLSEESNKSVIKGKGFVIINAENNIMPSIIGTLTSIISKSNTLKEGTFVLSMAQNDDLTTKISLRIAGNSNGFNLKTIMEEITARVGGHAGGHMNAAGGLIKTEKEDELIKIAQEVLEKKALEEIVS